MICNSTMPNMEDSCIYIEYGHFKRLFSIACFLLMVGVGFSLIYLGVVIFILFGIILIAVSIANIIDILFFKVLIIDSSYLTKEWYLFGKKTIKLPNLKARATNRIWEGLITLEDKNKSMLQTFYMNFETFPCKNRGYERIKEILIKNGIIKEDEACWNKNKLEKKNIWQIAIKKISRKA